ncbi:MAG: HD domain-containing phosphohydrolase [Acidobacteriota bacterium]
MLPAIDPDAERRAKELLYRCLEELGATKAALYLSGNAGTFELLVHYGFGRRDAIAADIKPGHPLWDWVRRHRTGPAFLNEGRDDPALGPVLEQAGTARLMTVPLAVGGRLVGLIDVRDKARRAPFAAGDLHGARAIGESIEGLIRELGLYGPAAPAGHSQPAQAPSAPVAPPEPRAPLQHAEAVESLAAFARAVSSLPGIAATAVTITDGRTVRASVVRAMALDNQQREALSVHQQTRIEETGIRLPPPSRWGWSEEDSGGSERRGEEIRTALLLAGPPLWVVLSVLTPRGGGAGEHVLALADRHYAQARALIDYRRSTRNLARILLEPGEAAFPLLRQHSQAVSELAQKLAAALGMSDTEEELVTLAGFLHDVGMRELDYTRLYRMERPGEMERRTFQRHPVVGARIVESSEYPGDLAAAIRHHHERWDGRGYPAQLAGRNIPLASRIVHLAEVWDTLTSAASYRRALGKDAAFDVIRAEAGRQFDPDLVPVLERVLRQ